MQSTVIFFYTRSTLELAANYIHSEDAIFTLNLFGWISAPEPDNYIHLQVFFYSYPPQVVLA
jgi:hypothetical protein